MKVVGLDLAGSEKRNTGFCLLDERLRCETRVLFSDEQIVAETKGASPDLVSIDAPLFLPKGRKSLEQRGPPHLRACDRELLRMKIRFFPLSLGPMRMLTARGMSLRSVFEGDGLTVIEGYPGAVQDVLSIPRKQEGVEKLRQGLIEFGVKGDIEKGGISADELDSICCALVGKMFLEDDYVAIGVEEEGFMILPRPRPR